MTITAMTTEEILTELKTEREKFTKCDEPRMKELVHELAKRKHYVPTPHTERRKTEGVEDPFFDMVEGYGVDWNEYHEPTVCPHCKGDLCDRVNGPPFKLTHSGSRDPQTNHRVSKCPHCGKATNP